mmetsp:Transcript_64709/g.153010  ORF Transcript_64709/g.153010 Transcript_64709/m.153010 type:complete len:143 (+) Transcript_64709:531-959(+)
MPPSSARFVVVDSANLVQHGVAVNALWPKTTIATAAVEKIAGSAGLAACRTPEIMADAAHWILQQNSKTCTGKFYIDEEALKEAGETDFSKQEAGVYLLTIDRYRVQKGVPLMPDLYVGEPAAVERWLKLGGLLSSAKKLFK